MHSEHVPHSVVLHSFRKNLSTHFGHIETKTYRKIQFNTTTEPNELSWEDFLQKVATLEVLQFTPEIQIACVGKPVTLSRQDINFFIASSQKEIRYFADLSQSEFQAIFSWHIDIAAKVSGKIDKPIHLIHGFNPEDTAPGTHSIGQKMHIHLFVPDEPEDIAPLANFEWFQRFSAVEPFTQVMRDYIEYILSGSQLTTKITPSNKDILEFEYTLEELQAHGWNEIYSALQALQNLYYEIEALFTDGTEENETGFSRFIPFDTETRIRNVTIYIRNQAWMSNQSKKLLLGLAHYLQPAQPRLYPMKIHTAGQAWLAKGFAGAISCVVDTSTQSVRVSFAPRIITTSAATKLFHEDLPVWVEKTKNEANEQERDTLDTFESSVVQLLREITEKKAD